MAHDKELTLTPRQLNDKAHYDEAYRAHPTLGPDGTAIFPEWVAWSPFEAFRLNKVVAKGFPHGDGDVTEDERKLDARDLAILRRNFSSVDVVRFYMLARLRFLFLSWSTGYTEKFRSSTMPVALPSSGWSIDCQ